MKNYKVAFLFNIFLFLGITSAAQEYIISLNGKSLELPDNPYEVVEVIDARPNKSYLGYLNGGNQRTKRPVIIESRLSASVLALFQSSFTSKSEQAPIIIKINKLTVFEEALPSSAGPYICLVFEINFDFYTKEEDTFYHEFTSGEYFLLRKNESSYGTDWSKKQIERRIAKEIERGYTEFLHRMSLNLGYHSKIEQQILNENSLNRYLLGETRNLNYENCIYYTFNGFRDNLVDTLSQFTVKSENNEYGFHQFDFKTAQIDQKDLWGVNFKKQLYLNVDGVFVPVKVTDSAYIIENMVSFNQSFDYFGPVVSGAIMLGPLGVGIGVTVTGAIDKKNRETALESLYKVDMSTGMPVPLEVPKNHEFDCELIFYTDKTNDQNFELFINGKKECDFLPDSYYSMEVTSPTNPLNVCLKSDSDEYCETISAEIFNTMYFEAIINNKGKVTLFEKKSQSSKTYIDDLVKKGKLAKIDMVKE